MKKNFGKMAVAVLLGSSIMFTSCIGSFGLTGKLYSWNNSVSNKWVNEIVFLAFCIVPVYEISLFADAVVLNTIEFWTGSNPIAEGSVKKVEGENGNYTITSKADGYIIEKEGVKDAVELTYNKEDNTWSVEADGESTKLLQIQDNNEVTMFLPNGGTMDVSLDKAGVDAFKQVVEQETYFAAR
jgi:hypothetical protein